ncbi:CGNR zinc finger domain-containing protein [Umezawaea beigongshangensis]|uniref:CGNR zinc finger domain-containing protein n=1 Tax=Umezawaea beigongshangensis TaxID=2780383 RepID=UPI0018F179F4|nr:CGNR zinc finger domain-containing protein [Umezawaea beigongshangensis]
MPQDWLWFGGRPSVDLLNTLRDRDTSPRDQLCTPEDLVDWLRLARVATVDSATEEHVLLAGTLRSAVDRAVLTGVPTRRDVATINRHARRFRAVPPQLRFADGVLLARAGVPEDPAGAALGLVAIDAIDVLTAGQPVRVCAATRCGVRFVDHSPAGNRQWCSMARCGNREKVRLHHARRRLSL